MFGKRNFLEQFAEAEGTQLQFKRVLEKLEQFLAKEHRFKDEILKAKEAYSKSAGKIQEQDQTSQQKNRAFFYWFLFDWEVVRHASYFHQYLHGVQEKSKPDYLLGKQLVKHQHSIFQLLNVNKKHTVVRDLRSKIKYRILDTSSLVGIEKNTFFETRLFTIDKQHCFADYFICHPLEVNSAISKGIKLIKGKQRSFKNFILQLQRFHLMWQRSTYIDVQLIYQIDKLHPKFKTGT